MRRKRIKVSRLYDGTKEVVESENKSESIVVGAL